MLNEEVLELCEYIASYSDAEDVDMDVARGRRVTKREKRLAESLNSIYCAIHAFRQNTKPGCKHEDWLKNAKNQYIEFKKL